MVDLKQYELISVDIFDTLLFRAVADFHEIFAITWKRAKECRIADIDLSPQEFMRLRSDIERNERSKKTNREITIQEIYEAMPGFISSDMQLLMQLEIETEKDYCYRNDDIYDLIVRAHTEGCKIVLLSDMYLSENIMVEVLKSQGIDLKLFSRIFISCDYGSNKQNGELFETLKKEYACISPKKMLHIGDHEKTDYEQAQKHGIDAYRYDVVPDKLFNIFDYEKIRHDTPLKEILSLRKLVVSYANQYSNKNQQTAYELGAGILGPFLSLFCYWTVNRMEKLNIQRIYPLMREGYLIGNLLEREIADRNLMMDVKPIYVSRKVTYIPSIKKIDREEIENIFGTRNLTIGEIIDLLGLKKEDFIDFSSFFDIRLKETHRIPYKNTTIKEKLIDLLLEEPYCTQIYQYTIQQRLLLIDYLKQEIGNFENIATIDIGFWGRIQMWMEDALEIEDEPQKMTHFLAMGMTGDKIRSGRHYEGFCSTTVENADLMSTIHRTTDVIEKMISVAQGSTIGYLREEHHKISVILGPTVHNPYLNDIMKGVQDFQAAFLKFRKKKPEIASACLNKRRETLMLLHRLIDLPRRDEAEFFTEIEADTNFGTTYCQNIITEENKALLEEKGIEYIDQCNVSYSYQNSNIVWPKGLITLYDEYFYVRRTLQSKAANEIVSNMQRVIERFQKDGKKECALYGAGENGRQFYALCALYHIKVSYFIDRKESLWGSYKEGIKIIGLKEAMNQGIDTFIITSLFSIDEIQAYIEKEFAETSKMAFIFSI